MDITFEQFLIGVLLLLLESALIFAWGFYKVIPKQQARALPAPASMERVPTVWFHVDNYQAQVYRFRNGQFLPHRKTVVATYTRSA